MKKKTSDSKSLEAKAEDIINESDLLPEEKTNIPFPNNNDSLPTELKTESKNLINDVNYIYLDNGLINWRAMIPSQFLYIQTKNERLCKAFEKQYGKDPKFVSDKDIPDMGIEDKFLLISLAGIKYVAKLRGILSYKTTLTNVVYDKNYQCVVSCSVIAEIVFSPNFETNNQPVTYCGVGGASLANTFDFAQRYIETIAENRAFVRAVRNFLNINVVSDTEIGPDSSALSPIQPIVNNDDNKESRVSVTGHSPIDALQQKCKNLNITFEQLKSNCSKKYKSILVSDPDTWESWLSIDQNDVYRILSKIKEPEAKYN